MKRIITVFLYLIITLNFSNIAIAKSIMPDDDVVLLKSDKTDIVKRYRSIIEKNPDNIDLIYQLSNTLLLKAKKENDTSLFGKIEAILVKNKKALVNDENLRIIYADVLQRRHAFNEAIKNIENIDTVQANIMRALIFQNTGNYSEAENECLKLNGKSPRIVSETCILHARSFTGQLKESYFSLSKLLKYFNSTSNQYKSWSLTALAEMASRLGELEKSEILYRKSYQTNPNNHILAEWVDSLHKLDKQKEIQALLKDKHEDLRLKLRYIRSLKLTQDVGEQHVVKELNKHIALIELREDKIHYDARIEYYLWINRDVNKAYYWAKKNWLKYKTPVAAGFLLATSPHNIDENLTTSVIEWRKSNNIEDINIDNLLLKKTTSYFNEIEFKPAAREINQYETWKAVQI